MQTGLISTNYSGKNSRNSSRVSGHVGGAFNAIRPLKPVLLLLTALVPLGLVAGPANAQATKQTADVAGQGTAGPIVSMNGATLWRSDRGLTTSLGMPTPEPGTYDYPGPSAFQPEGAFPGHPEAFSLWLFAFNDPAGCDTSPCTIADFAAGRGMAGAFSAGGHVVGGPNLQISGRVTINSEPFVGSPLLEPRAADVVLAVAPHGELQPDVMPEQISTPIGNLDFWWLASFLPE